jgi:hypothetical protein
MTAGSIKKSDASRCIDAIRLSVIIAMLILCVAFSFSMLSTTTSTNHAMAHSYIQGSIMLLMMRAVTNKPTSRAQSAMEYLMTYGWAILIVAIVLGALYSMGVFSASSTISTSCVPSSGYYCSISSYAHGSNIIANVGQNTGTNWGSWGYVFCSGCTLTTTGPSALTYNTLLTGSNTLSPGAQVPVLLPVPSGTPSTVGTVVAGTIWVCWSNGWGISGNIGSCTPSGTNSVNYARIATLTARAS